MWHSIRYSAAIVLSFLLQGCSKSDAPVDGAVVFKACASCHQIGINAHGGFGPELNGLFGRRAGSTPDYKYSDAIRQSGITWNEQTLSAFLRDPEKIVPGTKMRFWGLNNDRELAALLAYIHTYQDVH